MNLPTPNLDRKTYPVDTVRAMLVNTYKDAYLEGKRVALDEADATYRPKLIELQRLRLQVAHELTTTVKIIIDP